MNIPQQFRDIAMRMHQDVDLVLPDDIDHTGFIDYLVRPVGELQRVVAADFVDGLLSSNLSRQELVTVWARAGADWYMAEGDIVPFFEQLRDRLRTRPE